MGRRPGAYGGGDRGLGLALLKLSAPNNTRTLQSPSELLLLGLKKLLMCFPTQPLNPGYEGNSGVSKATLGSTALEAQQVGLEGERLESRGKRVGKG